MHFFHFVLSVHCIRVCAVVLSCLCCIYFCSALPSFSQCTVFICDLEFSVMTGIQCCLAMLSKRMIFKMDPYLLFTSNPQNLVICFICDDRVNNMCPRTENQKAFDNSLAHPLDLEHGSIIMSCRYKSTDDTTSIHMHSIQR
jgi:hypothetical protein